MVKRGEDGREKRPAILAQRLRRQLAGSRVELVIHPRVIAGHQLEVGELGHTLNSAIKDQSGIEYRAEEGALVADDALSIFRIFKGRQALRVGKGLQPILFVLREARKA